MPHSSPQLPAPSPKATGLTNGSWISPRPAAPRRRRSISGNPTPSPASTPGSFDAAFIGFFWSQLASSSWTDNCVESRNHPVTDQETQRNAYQRRRLADGSEWKVLKNFPTPDESHRSCYPWAPESSLSPGTTTGCRTSELPGGVTAAALRDDDSVRHTGWRGWAEVRFSAGQTYPLTWPSSGGGRIEPPTFRL